MTQKIIAIQYFDATSQQWRDIPPSELKGINITPTESGYTCELIDVSREPLVISLDPAFVLQEREARKQ